MTGWPGGCQGEGVEKAFFPDKVHRRGRQLGRVLATRYEEVVVDRLYPGKRQLESCLVGLIGEAEEILELRGEAKEIQNKRENTVLRVDGGGGTEADINWMLSRGYAIMVKLHNAKRTSKLARSVETWVSDEKVPERQIGLVTQPTPYVLPTRQLAIRHRKRGGKHSDEFGYSVLVFNSSDATLAELLDLHASCEPLAAQAMFNALHFYDLRGGALETQFKGDKQGLGLAHRNKRRFYAQEMLVLLGQLAHNVVVWSRNRLAQADPHFVHFGIRRMVRDVFRIEGYIGFDPDGIICACGTQSQTSLCRRCPARFLVGLCMICSLFWAKIGSEGSHIRRRLSFSRGRHHGLMLHSNDANNSIHQCHALVLYLISGACTYREPNEYVKQTMKYYLKKYSTPGARFHGSHYPQLWPREIR